MKTNDRRVLLTKLLSRWVDEHPRASTPALVYMGREYTPRDILYEVEHGTELGRDLTSFLFDASEQFQTPVEEFIENAVAANAKQVRR
jgi:hypothetical protein